MSLHQVRTFTEKGLAEFAVYVSGPKLMPSPPPTHLLFDDEYALPISPPASISQRKFDQKFELGMEVCRGLGHEGLRAILNNANVWAWLGLFYYESTFSKKGDGWFVGASSRHLVERIQGRTQDQSHRHLVKGAATNCYRFGTYARVLMDKADGQSKIEEQVMSRRADLGIAVHPEFVKALYELYWDKDQDQLKRGARGEGPGSITHVIDLLGQFDFTFDVRSMDAWNLIQILPPDHFSRFLQKRKVGKPSANAQFSALISDSVD